MMNLSDTGTTRETAAVDTEVVDTHLLAENGEYGIFVVRKSDRVVVRFDPRMENYPSFSPGDQLRISDKFWDARLRGRTGTLEKIQVNGTSGINGTADNIFVMRIGEREVLPIKLREVCFADPETEERRRRIREVIMEARVKYRTITTPNEINMLRGKKSRWGDFCYTYSEATIATLKEQISLPDSLYILVTDEKGSFVAFCGTNKDERQSNYFLLRELFVMPAYHGRGIGKELIKRSAMHARQKRAAGIIANVGSENIRMQGLCERMGFAKGEDSQGEDGMTYKKEF